MQFNLPSFPYSILFLFAKNKTNAVIHKAIAMTGIRTAKIMIAILLLVNEIDTVLRSFN